MAKQRVKNRVAQGGHDVPVELIERRYRAGLLNLHRLYLPLVENAVILDGNAFGLTANHRTVIQKQDGQLEIIQPEKWSLICQSL